MTAQPGLAGFCADRSMPGGNDRNKNLGMRDKTLAQIHAGTGCAFGFSPRGFRCSERDDVGQRHHYTLSLCFGDRFYQFG
jgi:hypothetical protein